MRVGIGFDAHPFVQGHPLILGGINIPHHRGLRGHSDADVLLHALMDAMLGATALGDLGSHFPASDPSYKGISSLVLLAQVKDKLLAAGWRVAQLDATIVAEKPTLKPFVQSMGEHIASCLSLNIDQVSIKATSTNGLGFIGREEGIAAYAVVSVEAVS